MSVKKAAARKRFEDVYITVRDELLAEFVDHGMPKEAIEYYKRNLDYNVPGGKLNRGLSVVDSVALLKGRELDEDEYVKAAVLGWAVEFLQAYFLVSDDMMDSSVTRRGQPCWYRVPDVGLIAVNDALLLEGAIFQMLRRRFRSEPYYVDLLDLFHDISYKTEMGQLIDLLTAPEDHVDLSKFSLERHKLIVIYKTAFYSFYLPVALAMLVCGFPIEKAKPSDPDTYKLAESILIPLGEYFQVQDDYLDYAGTPEQIGKIGTDILDNKCSWCINTALAVATPEQRAVLDANYGRKDADAEARVKAIYKEVGVDERYAEYEQSAYERISELIEQVPEVKGRGGDAVLKREVFRSFVNKIYKRTK
ncbi:farnesyl diphosphate synthase [Auriscalpium vulgare]|uniref:Farnesyl diphosphate synthase n=1 Tax=Auriscalpium vulgare TaxID=40419 RepID=A0ACB8S617_9AGAM|nr:farnesyl diphosphate synthase [Auriscalpium vulgare]